MTIPSSETNSPDPRPDGVLQRVKESFQRESVPLTDDRGRMRAVMDNLVLHLHPSKVAVRTLKFTYTWGLGGLAILMVMILAITGVMLMFVYTPTPQTAYNDILTLQTQVWYGQLIRNLHHWSGNLMVIVVFLHLLRVFFTGGFRTPREFNWVLGLVSFLLVIGANFTGYLLPWDQLAFWAVTVGASLLSYIPFIGDGLSRFILGGTEVSGATLTNFYGLHIAIIPLLLMGIASFHIWRVRKDTLSIPRDISEPPLQRVERVTTLPHLVSREFVFALVMTALILAWATWVNAPLEAAANPDHSPNPAKAAWYFMGLQELLLHFHPFFGAVVIPFLAFGALIALPYLRFDQDSEGIWFRSQKGRRMARTALIVGLVATPLLVLLDEYILDFAGWLPSLPTWISNGWLPLTLMILLLGQFWRVIKQRYDATNCETRQSLFVLLVTAFVVLTVIGIFFRGAGMALVFPWEVLA